MRAFVALVPPLPVVEDLADFLDARREDRHSTAGRPANGPRWTRDEHLHLTLAFLPELAERDLDEVSDSLRAACARSRSGPLRLAGAGAFPDVSQARVLWQKVEPDEDLSRLAQAVRTAAGRAGTTVEGGAFRPHLTVARLNRAQDATRYLRILAGYAGPSWQPEEVTLIRSHLGQGPRRTPRYEVVETFELDVATSRRDWLTR